MADAETRPSGDRAIDRNRYRRLRRFFAGVFLHALWWDLFLNLPLLRLLRRPPLDRWRGVARQYRALAVEMGGVMIKLGQFLSIRVDLLPPEITGELAGLQDEVPPERFSAIAGRIGAALGRPVTEAFHWIDPRPLGAASLAQAHRVRLRSGEEAVVKVLRPGIERLVETDLTAISLALGWLRLYRPVRDRVDLDWLAEEFTAVTRRELDLPAEGRSIERFAADFAKQPDVRVPGVHWEYTGRGVLTMEHVGYIKIGDLRAIEAAGIRRDEVADVLYRIYMQQVFETHFVHVDPHPGNLFVRPLPLPDETAAGLERFHPRDPVPHRPGRGFQIVLVDFGMAVEIPERLRAALREYAVGVGTRDARRIVKSLSDAGSLRPGADTQRLVEIHEAMFERFWGIRVGKMRDAALREAGHFMKEYRDVIYETPFQFQADMLFVVRAIGILSGMAANLDPEFDVWAKTIPYAERYAREGLRGHGRDRLREGIDLGRAVLGLPVRLEGVLDQARDGRLTVRAELSRESRKSVARLEQSVRRLAWMVLTAGLVVSGIHLHVGRPDGRLWWLFLLAAGVSFIRAVRRG